VQHFFIFRGRFRHARAKVHASGVPKAWITTRSVALCLLITMTSMTTSTSASAADPPSIQCTGYAACGRGPYTTHGYQFHSSTSYWNMYAGNNCTNYVAFVESTTFGVAPPPYRLGDAGQWPVTAVHDDAVVNHIPTVGSVAEWNGGSPGIPSPGHVAIVEVVGPQHSYIVISQQNILDVNDYDWTRINADGAGNLWEQWPSNFIHFPGHLEALRASAIAESARLVVRTDPALFGHARFEFNDGTGRIVTPGLVVGLRAGGRWGDYVIGFQSTSLARRYELHVTVQGSNVRVIRQGNPSSSSLPEIRIIDSGNPLTPAVVTLGVRPAKARPTTTTTLPTTTSSMPVATTSTTLP
jgi:surface antigen